MSGDVAARFERASVDRFAECFCNLAGDVVLEFNLFGHRAIR